MLNSRGSEAKRSRDYYPLSWPKAFVQRYGELLNQRRGLILGALAVGLVTGMLLKTLLPAQIDGSRVFTLAIGYYFALSIIYMLISAVEVIWKIKPSAVGAFLFMAFFWEALTFEAYYLLVLLHLISP